MLELKKYQNDAVTAMGENLMKQMDEVRHATTVSERKKTHVSILKSPTGSGKTLMMSAIIDRYLRDAITFVFSPGAGSLQVQTQRSLERFLDKSPVVVQELTPENIMNTPVRGTVFVKNWDALTKTDQDGMFTNRLSRHGETNSIFDFVKLVASLKIPMVVIIDESHYGKKGDATTVFKFLEFLHEVSYQAGSGRIPVMEFSATPVATEYSFKHVVTFEDSIRAGLSRQSIVINDGIEGVVQDDPNSDVEIRDTEHVLLHGACKKLLELEKYYEEAQSAYRPLMGIQLPTSALGKAARERIVQFLEEEYGWTVENGNVAVFMHEAKTEGLSNIASPESKVRVLLYKQAIATGWDCPRAQVFVGFRHMKSKTFTEQNLGRYCRTTEARHYTIQDTPHYEAMNQVYAYTNYSDNVYMSESNLLGSGDLKMSQVLNVNELLREDVELINSAHLPQSYVTYKYSRKLSTEIRKLMKQVHDNNPNLLVGAENVYSDHETLNTFNVELDALSSGSTAHESEVITGTEVAFSELKIEEDWGVFLRGVLKTALGSNIANFNTIVSEVGKNLAIRMKRATGLPSTKESIRAILYNANNHKLAVAYLEAFATEAKPYIMDGELMNTYEPVVRKRGRFTLPPMVTAATHEPYGNLLVTKQFYTNTANSGGVLAYRSVSPSMPEVRFENMLLDTFGVNNPYVEFRGMHKNSERVSDENFVNAIVIPVRDRDSRLRNFFPDYLLTFRNKETGNIVPMIVEVKGANAHDDDVLLHAKTKSAKAYMERTGLPFVVVKETSPGMFVLNENEGVTFEAFVNSHKNTVLNPVSLEDDCDWVVPTV